MAENMMKLALFFGFRNAKNEFGHILFTNTMLTFAQACNTVAEIQARMPEYEREFGQTKEFHKLAESVKYKPVSSLMCIINGDPSMPIGENMHRYLHEYGAEFFTMIIQNIGKARAMQVYGEVFDDPIPLLDYIRYVPESKKQQFEDNFIRLLLGQQLKITHIDYDKLTYMPSLSARVAKIVANRSMYADFTIFTFADSEN